VNGQVAQCIDQALELFVRVHAGPYAVQSACVLEDASRRGEIQPTNARPRSVLFHFFLRTVPRAENACPRHSHQRLFSAAKTRNRTIITGFCLLRGHSLLARGTWVS
jgi:hypothetical protein